MNLLQKVKTWNHNRKDPKKLFPNQPHMIEYAFSIAGTDYYRFNDIFNLPYERGLMALAVYEESRMKCSREYLEKHVETVRDLLRSGKIDIFKINQLNEQMNERLNLALDVDLLYKLASVVFFDDKENPVLYESEYCRKKITFWKENKGVADFFLQTPLRELIPFLTNVDFDLDTYSRLNEDLNKVHSEILQSPNSKSQPTDSKI
jgi:hypothetical protein